MWVSGNCCKMKCAGQEERDSALNVGIYQIDTTTANDYFKAYFAAPWVDSLKAFTINRHQFNAMKLIAENDTSVHGFRIYMGLNGQTPVRMVVGTGSPDKLNTIYVTDNVESGPCPDICDNESPIIDK